MIKGYLFWLSSNNSSFNSASRVDKGCWCCRRRRGVIGVTTTDSVGDDESMRSYLSPIEGKGDRQVDRQEFFCSSMVASEIATKKWKKKFMKSLQQKYKKNIFFWTWLIEGVYAVTVKSNAINLYLHRLPVLR